MRNTFNRLPMPAVIAALACVMPTASFAQTDHTVRSRAVLEEVVVTAQRRQENLQEVPIAVIALGAETLASAGVDATVSLPELVPSVQLVRSGPSAMFFMRGVGNTSGGTGEEGANAIYVDGVYIADMKTSALKFNNIERVEVLRGPQGTLFGRNSSGGLINVITRTPGSEFEAQVNVGAANYDSYSSQLYVAGPLSDTLSADIAFTGTDQNDGWGRNALDGREVGLGWDWAVRSKWVWEPTADARFILAGGYGKESTDFSSAFRLAPGSVAAGGIHAQADAYDSNSNNHQFTDQRNKDLALTMEFDLHWATLTSITGYRDNTTHSSLDPDLTPLPLTHIDLRSSITTFQEELRLASTTDGSLSWQTGVFFLNSTARLSPQQITGAAFGAPGIGNAVYSKLELNSYAAFGELTYTLTPSTQLTAGVRYTRDETDFNGRQVPVGGPGTTVYRDDSMNAGKTTYRLALRQDITDNVNVYASYNRGFKAGTYSMSALGSDPVSPQEIDAFEVGLKSELFDSRVRLNGAAFYYEISDYQVRAATEVGATAQLLNAAEVEIRGFELELEAAPTEHLHLFAAATWLDTKFSKFPFAPHTYPNPASCAPGGTTPGVVSGAPSGGAITCIGSAKGNDTPLAPDFAGNIGGTYTIPLATGEVRLSASYSYNDGYYFEVDNRLHQPSYGTLNASVVYEPNQHWSVELWGRNLEDETYYIQKLGSALGDVAVAATPRTYGINFRYNY